mgnify:CR=1 FL=1
MAYTASEDKWITLRGAGGTTVRVRLHGGDPEGNGDFTVDEDLLSRTDINDPNTDIYDGNGEYTHGGTTIGPFSVYQVSGFVYETPDPTDGYYGDGSIDTWIGYHGTADGGTPSTAGPATLEDLTETFRYDVPWDGNVVEVRYALDNNDASEDGRIAFYDWTSAVAQYPTTGTHPLLRDEGRLNASAGGASYRFYELGSPLAVTGGNVLGICYMWGSTDAQPASAVTTLWDAGPATGGYLTGWVDNGREWSDMVPEGGEGYDGDAQYLTLNGDMPQGDPDLPFPDPFDPAPTDFDPNNQFRQAWRFQRDGISGS